MKNFLLLIVAFLALAAASSPSSPFPSSNTTRGPRFWHPGGTPAVFEAERSRDPEMQASAASEWTIKVTGVTANSLVAIIPANCYIKSILVVNTTMNAITGGLAFGTTSGGTDIYSDLTVGASAFAWAADASLAKRMFSTTAQQSIYLSANSAWDSADVTIDIVVAQA